MKTCGNCGEHVSEDFYRVFSYQGELEACPNCTVSRSRLAYQAAGIERENISYPGTTRHR